MLGLFVVEQPAGPVIWAGATSGRHQVGVARIADSRGDITYWYPAGPGGRPSIVREFSDQSAGLAKVLAEAGLRERQVSSYLDATLAAHWGAPGEGKGHALILIAQGNQQDAMDQAVLAEIVASHGFVVATMASPTIKSPMQSPDDVGPTAQKQAEDLSAVLTRMASLNLADVSRTVVIGHSFGARAALLLAMHDPRVRALISLDGGIGTATAQESFQKAPWFSSERGTAAILHFYETTEAAMTPDFTLLRSLPSRSLTLRELQGLKHVHFTTLGFEASVDDAMRRLTGMGQEGSTSLRAMVEEMLAFLSAQTRS